MIRRWLDRWLGRRAPGLPPSLTKDDPPSQERIAKALAHSGYLHVVPQQAARRLQKLPGYRLLVLDQAVRSLSEFESPPAQLAQDPDERVAQWFVLGCSRNGYARQRALQAMRRHPGRLATALALIRCDDWVPQVRDEAHRLLTDIVRTEGAKPLFELGGLISALRARQRAQAYTWPELIEPTLRNAASAIRWQAISTGDAQARAIASIYTLDAEPDRAYELGLNAITDVDPQNARWALEAIVPKLLPDQRYALVKAGLAHPQPRVRVQALRLLDSNHCETQALLEQRLMDLAAAPRAAAAYLLRHRHGIDPLPLWRVALAAGTVPQALAALLGLADHAQPEDVAAILPWTRHRAGAVRAIALRALVRCGTSEALEQLPTALSDPSVKVQRQALALYRKLPGLLSIETLDALLQAAPSEAVRSTLVLATRDLDRWSALKLLLRGCKQTPNSLALRNEVAQWANARASQATPLPASLREELELLLNETDPCTITERASVVHAMKHASPPT